ncbi:MAG: SgcJ/EcaC family oxidoreductase [Armatimonadetes bacterium]|nr:SgcJ/EcaC family oxidoreductase [Armatimonadota bacterium]
MTSLRTLLGITLLASVALAPCGAQRGPAPDVRAIRRLLDAYQDAWNRHDAHAFSLVFTPDAEFTNVRGVPYPGGRAGIEKAHAPLFATMFRDSHNTTTAVHVKFLRPDVAAVEVRWRMTGARDRQGRPRPPVIGLRDMVLTKDKSGHWLIAVFHNVELPPTNQ